MRWAEVSLSSISTVLPLGVEYHSLFNEVVEFVGL